MCKSCWRACAIGLLLCAFSSIATAVEHAGISDVAIAELASRAMAQFEVPGMAIGIVKANKTLYAQGFGVREIGKPGLVDVAQSAAFELNMPTTTCFILLPGKLFPGSVARNGESLSKAGSCARWEWSVVLPLVSRQMKAAVDLSIYTGRYRDPWFGDVTIKIEAGRLVFSAAKSPRL